METDDIRVSFVSNRGLNMDVVQNEWQDNEFECFKDPVNMLFGWCCSLCMVCDNAKRLDQSVGMFCCLGYCCPLCAIFSLRSKTRERYGIDGTGGKDCLCSFCCPACVNCQVNRELRKRDPQAEGLFPIPNKE